MKLFENFYLHHTDGSLPENAWSGTKVPFMVYTSRPGLQRYRAQRRGFFDDDFVRFVDGKQVPDMKSGAEVSELGIIRAVGSG